jgi:hypothetical protein
MIAAPLALGSFDGFFVSAQWSEGGGPTCRGSSLRDRQARVSEPGWVRPLS